jgi:TonB family protein
VAAPSAATTLSILCGAVGIAIALALPVLAQTQPAIVGSPLRWISNDDYPSAALRQQREGRVRYRLIIDGSGRVSQCDIMASSGHEDLDAQTCRLISRRARFVKAADPKQPRYFESLFSWNIYR